MKEAISGQTCSFPSLFVKAQLILVPKGGRSFYFQSLSHHSEGLAICRPFSKGLGGVEDKNHNLEAHAGYQLRCNYFICLCVRPTPASHVSENVTKGALEEKRMFSQARDKNTQKLCYQSLLQRFLAN